MILTLEHEGTVRRIAGRILRTSERPSAAKFQALVTAGRLALADTYECHDPRREQSFVSYQKQVIHFAMFDALRAFEKPARNREKAA